MLEDVKKTLRQLGFQESEVKVYFTCFQNRPGLFVSEIAKQTGIKRSTVNLILDRMCKKGLVTYHLDGARKRFVAEEPEGLLFRLEDSLQDFRALIPILRATDRKHNNTKVRFFEGKEGVRKLFTDVLLTLKISKDHKKELLAVTSGRDIFEFLPEHQKQFIDKRVKERLPLKIIASDDKASRELERRGTSELRQVKFFDPKKYPFNIEINIYGNSVAFINFDGALSGVIVENQILSSSFRGLFNLLWDSLK